MSGAVLPPVIPEPFAKNADPSFIQNPIPQTTAVSGRASYDQGFPAITMQPVAAGGKPPFGQDFNGLFFALTSQQYFTQAGQLWPYNAAVAAAIGGYGVGAVLSSSDGITVWLNVANANMTDPDSNGNFGWVSLFTYGYTTKTLTGGSYTMIPGEYRAPVIIINGALAGNQTVIIPPQLREWLIVNNTSGGFTLTVRSTIGSGVIIPQGGFSSPVGVYSDGTNFYPTVPAASLIPADQNATALTLAQRTNAGYLLATYFNQSSPIENPPIGAVFVQNSSGDGFIRKASLAYFESVMSLSSIGGQVSAGQVPSAAVTQYAAAILASAALTGVPTTPTPASGSSNGQVCNTAFANPFSILAMPGAFRLPSGHLVCYGTANPNGGAQTVTLPGGLSYSSAGSYSIQAISVAGGSVQTWVGSGSVTANSFSLHNSGGSAFWFTVGF
jgi:hypothetical protein